MARWLVPLAGERFDLEEFVRWFPTGGIHVIEEDEQFYFIGPHLEMLADAEAVRNEAQRWLEQFASIILLLEPSMRRPTINGVTRETDEGKRHQYIFASGHIGLRSILSVGTAIIGGTEQQLPQNTVAQDFLQRINTSPHLEAAITLWGRSERSWPQLYRILEELEKYLGKPVNLAGLCSNNKRTRFTSTANNAEVAGIDARHALKQFDPPPKPMTLQEANEFIGHLLISVLRRPAHI